MKTKEYKFIARLGYFSLLLLIPTWGLWLSPTPLSLTPWVIMSVWFIPLLFPLRGIINGDPYTYAWCGFLGILYSIHALVVIYIAYNEHVIIEIQLAIAELICSSLFILGCFYYAKRRAKELAL